MHLSVTGNRPEIGTNMFHCTFVSVLVTIITTWKHAVTGKHGNKHSQEHHTAGKYGAMIAGQEQKQRHETDQKPQVAVEILRTEQRSHPRWAE